MTAKPRKPLLVNLTWAVGGLVGFTVLYVLSYAPVYRQQFGVDPGYGLNIVNADRWGFGKPLSNTILVYRPVEWLIDHTPLKEPLLWWAGLWKVRENMSVDMVNRQVYPNGYPNSRAKP